MQQNQEDMFLGIDYGEKRTGLAFGRAGLEMPLEVFDSVDIDSLIAKIGRTVVENKITKVIMGLPVDVDGRDTAQATRVRKFAKILKIKLKRPVEFVSEYGTSQEAIEGAIRTGVSRKNRRVNDHYSAALILRRYFSSLSS